jgi:hypothetical protein
MACGLMEFLSPLGIPCIAKPHGTIPVGRLPCGSWRENKLLSQSSAKLNFSLAELFFSLSPETAPVCGLRLYPVGCRFHKFHSHSCGVGLLL